METIANSNCTLCEYGNNTAYPKCIMQPIKSQKDLMIVVECPNWEDARSGIVMQSKRYELLIKVLTTVLGLKEEDYHLSYLIKCVVTDKKASKKNLEICVNAYLDREIQAVNPRVILTLGEQPMSFLLGWKKITKVRGKLGEYKGVQTIPTYSSFYVDNTPSNMATWVNDIHRAFLLSKGIETDVRTKTAVVYCDTFEKIKTAVSYCQGSGMCTFDFETVKIPKEKATFDDNFFATLLSLTFQTGSAYVIPLEHKDSPYTKEDVMKIMSYLGRELFLNPLVRKVAHNLNFDFHVLRTYGINRLRGRIDDTMLMQHLVDETKQAKLKVLVSEYFPEYAGYQDELDDEKWKNKDLVRLVQYGGTDTNVTYQLCLQLETLLLRDERSYVIYRSLTMAAFRPLWEAEERGMFIKRDFLRAAIKEVKGLIRKQTIRLRGDVVVRRYESARRAEETERLIQEEQNKLDKWCATHPKGTPTETKYKDNLNALKTGGEVIYHGVMFSSWQQLEDLLYDHPSGFRHKTVDRGTGKDTISELKDPTKFIENLIVWRSLNKTLATYLEGIYDRLDANDRVHTSFRLNGTVSGRISSANPNLQNISKDSKLKHIEQKRAVSLIKKSFGVPKGFRLLGVDYSQAELRIIAEFADEQNMVKVYQADGDIHSKTAASMMGIEGYKFDKKNPDHAVGRGKAKAVNFGFIYGMSAAGFQVYAKTDYSLELSYEDSIRTRNVFFDTYPKLLDYHATYIKKGRKFGYVRTLFGRRRHLPEINNFMDDKKRSMAERIAINDPIQGTAGEFTIFAIALLYHRLPEGVYFVNTVHDSIMFYIPEELWDYTIPIIKECCENLPTLKFFNKELKQLGMRVDFEQSNESWGDLAELEEKI